MIAWVKLEMLCKVKQTNHFAFKSQLYLKALKNAFELLQQLKIVRPKLAAAKIESFPLLG